MAAFADTLKTALAQRGRQMVLALHIRMRRSEPAGSFDFTATWEGGGRMSPLRLISGAIAAFGADPIVLSAGRHLIGQDFELYGDAETVGAIVFKDVAPGAAVTISKSIGEPLPETLTDVLNAGWVPIGQLVTLYIADISDESQPNVNRAETIGVFTCTSVEFGAGTVSFVVADEKKWNREIPFIRVKRASLGDDWPEELNTPDEGRPVPFHFGYRGRGHFLLGGYGWDPEGVVNAEIFQGYADPWNPAPCVLLEPNTQHSDPFERNRSLWAVQESGVRSTHQLWNRLDDEAVHLNVGGQFAYLGALGDANLRLKVLSAKNPESDNPSFNDIDMATFTMDVRTIEAHLPIYPTWHDTIDGDWEDHYHPSRYQADPSAMFSGDLRTGTSLYGITDTINYTDFFQNIGGHPNHGTVMHLTGFAVVTVSNGDAVDLRMKMALTGAATTTVVANAVQGDESLKLVKFDFDGVLNAHGENIGDWHFHYNTGASGFAPMKLGIGVRKDMGSSGDPNIIFHSVGLRVSFQPTALRDAMAVVSVVTPQRRRDWWDYYIERTPLAPPRAQPPREYSSTAIYVSGAAQADDVDAIYSGTPFGVITNPVGMLFYIIYEKTGTGDRPAPQGPQNDVRGGHGQWIKSREALDNLAHLFDIAFLSLTWRGVYTQHDFTPGAWTLAQEFMGHLPIYAWRDRTDDVRCALWMPEPLPGESIVAEPEYFYEPALDLSHVVSVGTVRLSPIEKIKNEIVVDWDWHEGQRKYMRQATLNRNLFDDGVGQDLDTVIGYHKAMCKESAELVGTRTLNIRARTVYRFQESASLLIHYARKFARRHVEMEVVLDIQCADLEPMQFVRFTEDTVAERTGRSVVPLLGGEWHDHWFRVVRRFIDYDRGQVAVTLRSVTGAF